MTKAARFNRLAAFFIRQFVSCPQNKIFLNLIGPMSYLKGGQMALEYAPLGLVGLLTPQANTTVEPEAWALLPNGYSLVNARMVSQAANLNDRLLDYVNHVELSVSQFSNAPLSVLSLACTGSSYLMGQETETRWVQTWQQRLRIPVVTAGLAVVQALRSLNARRIDLVSPYPEDLTKASVAYWTSYGFDVGEVKAVRISEQGFHPIYQTCTEAATLATEELSQSRADAVLMLGTGMPTLNTLLANRGRFGPPVLSCMLALIWQSVMSSHSAQAKDSDLSSFRAWMDARHWASRAQAMGMNT